MQLNWIYITFHPQVKITSYSQQKHKSKKPNLQKFKNSFYISTLFLHLANVLVQLLVLR